MREIALDTETTGLSPQNGDRIVEIGCVELINHMPSGRTYQTYLNPQKTMDPSAEEVHGLSNDFLKDQPLFKEIASEFLEFISDSPLIIHNAEFDIGFLNSELKRLDLTEINMDQAIDTLKIARDMYPGAQNSLDALCRRFDINNYDRTYHGAMLDTNILADVYFHLTGGQSKFEFSSNLSPEANEEGITDEIANSDIDIPSFKANSSDVSEHKKRLNEIESQNNITTLWNQL